MVHAQQTRHSVFNRAERWWWYSFWTAFAGVTASIGAGHWASSWPAGAIVMAAIAVMAPIATSAMKWKSNVFASQGDHCRRTILYQDSLGEGPEGDEARMMGLWPSDIPLSEATQSVSYFASGEPAGARRLADNVGESAFYTAELAKIMSSLFAGAAIAPVLAVFLSIDLASENEGHIGANTLISTPIEWLARLVLLFIFVEVVKAALEYHKLSCESADVYRRAMSFNEQASQSLTMALRLSEKYSVALAANLPIPNRLYQRQRERIDRAYRDRVKL